MSALEAIPDPQSLIELRARVRAMLPRVGLPEVILEVMSWLPGFVGSFTSISGGRSRLDDLDVSIAACLSAHARKSHSGQPRTSAPVFEVTIEASYSGRASAADRSVIEFSSGSS